jgi:methyltransferase (TIGR00027 family)
VGQQQWDIVSGVGLTALGVTFVRAVESRRPDRLIDDPLASAFLAAAAPLVPARIRKYMWDGTGVPENPIGSEASHYMGVRSRFFDDYLLSAARPTGADRLADGAGVGQVVIVAAGLDVRAYRLDWPAGLRLFEIDQPKVLEFKETVLRDVGATARCRRTAVAADLRADWPGKLLAAGFSPDVPTAWLMEGLLPYLPADAERRLFEHLDALSAPGSRLAAEYATDAAAMVVGGEFAAIAESVGFALSEVFDAEVRPSPGEWLSGSGWVTADEPAIVVAERYRRVLVSAGYDDQRLSKRAAEYMNLLTAHRG